MLRFEFLAASPMISLVIASVHLTDGRNKPKQTPSCQYITSTDDCKEQFTIFLDKDCSISNQLKQNTKMVECCFHLWEKETRKQISKYES